MTTTTNTADAPAFRWTSFVPVIPEIPQEDALEFFETAPTGTVIEVWDDLYKRLPGGRWRELENIVQGDGFYESSEHNDMDPQELLRWATGDDRFIRVLKMGND